jgi:IrrE N-terminal-like domain
VADVESIATETLKALRMWKVPVDPFLIAKEEGIELAPGEYGQGFDARIEYIPAVGKFILFFKSPGPGRTEGRVRFSIAHELGHYYIGAHREYLLRGENHNSVADFRSKDPREKEADEFAACLLMPHELFVAELKKRQIRDCNLADLKRLSEQVFNTSLTSTVLRYVGFDWEPCAMIVSSAGHVVWARQSDSMKAIGMSYIANDTPIPNGTPTAKLLKKLETADDGFCEGSVDAELWYERPWRNELWEEAIPLGNTGLVLTFLVHDDSGNSDDD